MVTANLRFSYVIFEYIIISLLGVLLSLYINIYFLFTEIWLLLMGFLYNVKPFRTKDIPYLDVLSESVNNIIRLLLGWFIVTDDFLPPVSILIAYWMCATVFTSIFIIEYRVEYILALPMLIGLFILYFNLAFKEDSVVQKPEKLYREKKLLYYLLIFVGLLVFLTFTDLPILREYFQMFRL